MGNYINPSLGSSSFLLNPINPTCESLTNWKKNSILNFHITYLYMFPISLCLTHLEFSKLVQQSTATIQIDSVFAKYKSVSYNTINILELLSTIITYSSVELEDKVIIAFNIFDFDHSKKMSLDEFGIMCKSFFKGIKAITAFNADTLKVEEKILNNDYNLCEVDSEGQITTALLIKWVKSNKILSKLFKKAHLMVPASKRQQNVLPNIKKRRKSSLTDTYPLPSFLITTPGLKDYSELFHSCCNRNKKAQVSVLYNKMIKIQKFKRYANEFFNSYHFKLNAELTHQDFLNYFKNYTENPYVNSYKFVETRRKGFLMETPQGAIKSVLDGKENKEKSAKKVLLKIFNQYDENKDGLIDLKELKTALQGFVTTKGVEELFSEFDEDRNSTLDFEEFMNMFKPKTFELKRRKSQSLDFDNY